MPLSRASFVDRVEQCRANAESLSRRQHRDVVDVEVFALRPHHDDSDDHVVGDRDMNSAIVDERRVVGQHRSRLLSDRGDVVLVRGIHALDDTGFVGRVRRPHTNVGAAHRWAHYPTTWLVNPSSSRSRANAKRSSAVPGYNKPASATE